MKHCSPCEIIEISEITDFQDIPGKRQIKICFSPTSWDEIWKIMSKPRSERHVVEDGRHYKNPFEDYSENTASRLFDAEKNDIHESLKATLIDGANALLAELERNRREWYNRGDCSIYTGNAGVALMYYLLGEKLQEPSHTSRALELVEKSLRDGKGDKRVSYLAGNAGPLALGAVLHKAAGNDEEFRRMISKLCSTSSRALVEKSDELLYGRVGYLYALLYVNTKIPSRPIEKELIEMIVGGILKSGREYATACSSGSPLMYQWHEKEYLGGAHGLAGILYVLLQAREYLTEAQLREDIEPALDYLVKLRFPSGNFPSSVGNQNDKLVHWCHGAPSMTMLFTLAYRIFKKESYLKTALDCGDVVWSRGLLRKGHGLCHGVSGNAYAFLSLYRETEDPRHIYRACKFAEWCVNHRDNRERIPDRPFSLFEGLAGTIYLLVDLLEPRSAKFPAYTL